MSNSHCGDNSSGSLKNRKTSLKQGKCHTIHTESKNKNAKISKIVNNQNGFPLVQKGVCSYSGTVALINVAERSQRFCGDDLIGICV